MTGSQISSTRRSLTSPRGAAVAGILFALLYGAGLALIRLSIPTGRPVDTIWLESNGRWISLALNLVPFAGIAFLWFIGVIRDHLGGAEDRLFATVFLGSGLIFLTLTFTGAALAGGLLSSYGVASHAIIESGVFTYGREVMFQIINIYAIRMAGVFMISLGSIWLRTDLMHRGWALFTYALALVLLLSISLSLWVSMLFPVWVLAVSVYYLLRAQSKPSPAESTNQGVT